ncbi:MAG: amidohydrolase family protein [Luteimonas sp.]
MLAAPVSAATVEYANARWFDGTRFHTGTRYAVDGVLQTQRPAQVDARVDLGARWVVPPYGEAHNHNLQNPYGWDNFHGRYVEDGVFYAAMMCGSPDQVEVVKEKAKHGGKVGVAFASACISSSDGHPLGMTLQSWRSIDPELQPEHLYDRSYLVMDQVADVDRKWPLVRMARPDLVKAILVHSEDASHRGDPAYFGKNGLEPAVLDAVVAKAHKERLRVAVHVTSAADFAAAVAAGADIIAHLPGNHFFKGKTAADYRLSDTAIAQAARRGVVVVTTAVLAKAIPGEDPAKQVPVQALQRENLQRLKAAGVRLALGRDLFGNTVLAEVDYLRTLDVFTPAELLRLLSQDTPRLVFPDRRIGCLEAGCEADFLVLEADPLADLDALRRIYTRVLDGAALPAIAR